MTAKKEVTINVASLSGNVSVASFGSVAAGDDEVAIRVDRTPITHDQFLSSYDYHRKESHGVVELTKSAVKSKVSCAEFDCKNLLGFVPMIKWLPSYKMEYFIGDLVAGLTVAVMNIPQGMAYALLAGLPPVNGLYMACFPAIIYMIFSTSRHNSVGFFAVIMLMTGTLSMDVLDKYNKKGLPGNSTDVVEGINIGTTDNVNYTHIQIVTLITFTVGLAQTLMGLLRMGAMSVLMSDVLISGLTTGASVHILTSQVKGIVGLKVPRFSAFPKILREYYYILDHIYESNVVALVMSIFTIFVLIVHNDLFKPWLAKRCRFPVPIELLTVVAGICYSYFMKLPERYQLPIVGTIPAGIPFPEAPPFNLIEDVVVGCVVIAILSFAVSHSIAVILAKRGNYKLDANQELIAHGLSNVFATFFQCAPSAASFSKSLIQQDVGGKTQIATGISCFILIITMLFLGPIFEPLPTCILSSIIIVSLKGMLMQVTDLAKAWESSKLDALVWFTTFTSVVFIDMDYGLAIGVGVSLVTLLWRNQHAYACTLGEIPNTSIYVDVRRFSAAVELHNVKIFHFGAGLHFANRDYFKEMLFSLTELDPVKWYKDALKLADKEKALKKKIRKGLKRQASVESNKSFFRRTCCGAHESDSDNADDDDTPDFPSIFSVPKIEEPSEDVSNEEGGGGGDEEEQEEEEEEPKLHEIKKVKFDRKVFAGKSSNDSLALPSSTGLKLRRKSIYIDAQGHPLPFKCLLIDLSGISFVDMAGVKLLKSLVQDYDKINVKVIFAGTVEPVYRMFRKMHFLQEVPAHRFFPTVNDAVVCSKLRYRRTARGKHLRHRVPENTEAND